MEASAEALEDIFFRLLCSSMRAATLLADEEEVVRAASDTSLFCASLLLALEATAAEEEEEEEEIAEEGEERECMDEAEALEEAMLTPPWSRAPRSAAADSICALLSFALREPLSLLSGAAGREEGSAVAAAIHWLYFPVPPVPTAASLKA